MGRPSYYDDDYRAMALDLVRKHGLAGTMKLLPDGPKPSKPSLKRWANDAGIDTRAVTVRVVEHAREELALAKQASDVTLEKRQLTMAQEAEDTARWVLERMREPVKAIRRIDGADVPVTLEVAPARDLDAYASAVSKLVVTSRLLQGESTSNGALQGSISMSFGEAQARVRQLRDQLAAAPDPPTPPPIVTVVPRSA